LRLADQAAVATNSEVQYATAMSAAALNAKAIANDERGFLLSGDDEFLVQMESRIPLAREAFADAIEVSDDAQRARLAEILLLFEDWLELVDEEIAMYRAGDVEAAQEASVGRTREVRHEYERILTEASLIQSGVPRVQAEISSLSGVSLAVLLGYLVVAILIALGVGAWAASGVRRGDDGEDEVAARSAVASRHPEVPGP
jgi:methyl-accepting chemotaxis protein